jgi:hypothetical protein
LDLGIPRKEVQEVIGVQVLVMIEYIAQLLIKTLSRGDKGTSHRKQKETSHTTPLAEFKR